MLFWLEVDDGDTKRMESTPKNKKGDTKKINKLSGCRKVLYSLVSLARLIDVTTSPACGNDTAQWEPSGRSSSSHRCRPVHFPVAVDLFWLTSLSRSHTHTRPLHFFGLDCHGGYQDLVKEEEEEEGENRKARENDVAVSARSNWIDDQLAGHINGRGGSPSPRIASDEPNVVRPRRAAEWQARH